MHILGIRSIIWALITFALLAAPLTPQEYQPIGLDHADKPTGVTIVDHEQFEYLRYPGIVLRPGDTLRTDTNRVELTYPEIDGVFRLNERTEIRTLTPTPSPNTEYTPIELVEGQMRLTLARNSQMVSVNTTVSEVVTTGSDTVIDYEAGSRHSVEVYAGAAVVHNKLTGEELIVPFGCRYDFYSIENQVSPINPATARSPETSCMVSEIPQKFYDIFSDQLTADLRHISANEEEILRTLIDGRPSDIAELEDESDAAIAAAAATEAAAAAEEASEAGALTEEELAQETEEGESDAIDPSLLWTMPSDTFFYFGIDGSIMSYEQKFTATTGIALGFESPWFGIGLHAPLQYAINPIDPTTWYTYYGSHNWSFEDGGNDVLRDIATKVEYLRVGDIDKIIYAYAGELRNIRIGRGIVINRYANNLDMPLQYNVGAYASLQLPIFNMQLMSGDITQPLDLFSIGVQLGLGPVALGVDLTIDEGIGKILRSLELAPDENNISLTILSLDVGFGLPQDSDQEISGGLYLAGAFFLANNSGPFQFNWSRLNRQDGLPFINNFLLGLGGSINTDAATIVNGLYGWGGIATPLLINTIHERRGVDIANRVLTTINDPDSASLQHMYLGLHIGFIVDSIQDLEIRADYVIPFRLPIQELLNTSIIPTVQLPAIPLTDMLLYTADYFSAAVSIGGESLAGLVIDLEYSRAGFFNTIFNTNSYSGASILDGNSAFLIAANFPLENIFIVRGFISSSTRHNTNGQPLYAGGVARTDLTFGISLRLQLPVYIHASPDAEPDAESNTESNAQSDAEQN